PASRRQDRGALGGVRDAGSPEADRRGEIGGRERTSLREGKRMAKSSKEPGLAGHEVVSHSEWTAARKALLAQEKEFTHQREKLAERRRALPWETVEKEYVFEGPRGKETLADLFGGRSQLMVYQFMFAPDWDAGCPHCSFWADHYDGMIAHLNQRDA